jgi:hypothetical protein
MLFRISYKIQAIVFGYQPVYRYKEKTQEEKEGKRVVFWEKRSLSQNELVARDWRKWVLDVKGVDGGYDN